MNGEVPSGTYCQDVATWSTSDAAQELELVSALDTLRRLGLGCEGGGFGTPTPSPSLSLSPELRCSARRHARDMVERGYFSQTTPEGEAPETRMRLAGYSSSVHLEAIAQDQTQAYPALEALLSVGGDCDVLLDPRMVAIGVGKFESLWTVDLAGVRAP